MHRIAATTLVSTAAAARRLVRVLTVGCMLRERLLPVRTIGLLLLLLLDTADAAAVATAIACDARHHLLLLNILLLLLLVLHILILHIGVRRCVREIT